MAQEFKMSFSDDDFGDKPKASAKDVKLNKLANDHLEKSLPKMVDVYNLGKSKDFSAKQANLAKYATFGSETYGKLGFDPFKSGGIPGKKSGMDVLYDKNTHWSQDIGRAWDGMWKLAGIGFQDTIGLGAFAASDNYLDFEDTMNKYSSSRGGNAGFWSNTMLSSGYTVGIIGGIAAEELALAGITALSGGTAAPGTLAAGGTLLARGVAKIKEAGNMLKLVNKLQDIKTASGFVGKSKAAALGFGKALNPLENTMDFLFTADKLKDLNGWKQAALGAGAIVRDARKITMSHSESKLEAQLAQKEFREKMYDEYYSADPKRAGKPISNEMANRIEHESQKVHDRVYAANFGLIYATNAITFDNMLKTMKGTNKFFSNATDLFKVVQKEGGKVAVEALKKNVWNYGRKKLGELSWKGSLKSMLSSSMEGVQELGQDIISESLKTYHARNVKGTQLRGGMLNYIKNDLKEATLKQKSEQGWSTFLSGALMGVFASPVGIATQATQGFLFDGGVQKTYQYFTDRDAFVKEKLDAEARRKQTAKDLTQFFNDHKNFLEVWSKPLYSQSEIQEEILEAGERGDQKTMKNKQHDSFVNGVHTLLKSGMENEFAKHLESLGELEDAQNLNEIFGRTDITDENKGKYQQKLKDNAKEVRDLRGVYDEIQNTINNSINLKTLDKNDPDYIKKLHKYIAVENLKKELLFSHAKIADRANRQNALRTEINNDSPLSTLEINALIDDSSLQQQIKLLEAEIETNSKLTVTGDTAVQNQASARAKLKAYKNYQEKLNEYRALNKNENESISESDKFDDLFEAYNQILEVSGKNKLINSDSQKEYNKKQFDKVYDYLSLGEEKENFQEFIDTVLNPSGADAFTQGQEEMLKRLEENKEDHILNALYEFDKKAVSDDMLNELYDNNLFFDLKEIDDLLNKGIMPKEIFDITNNKLATPEQLDLAQKIIGSYIKKLKGKTINVYNEQLNKQGRKLKSDKRTVAGILRQYRVKLNESIKLNSKEGKRLMAKLLAAENKYTTKLDREILEKLGELDITIKFVSDNNLPVKLTEDGVLELDIRFAGKDYTNSVMSFENLVVTGLTQFAITEKLKANDDLYMAARSAMEQAKAEFQKKYPSTNADELSVFEDVNVFMTEAMNDLQFQKFLATVEDNIQPASKSLWSTLSDGISEIVKEDFDKKLANRVINIAAKALDDSIIDNIAETQEESKEVREQKEKAKKEKSEELTKLAKELGVKWNVNVQIINTQAEAEDILNNIKDPFFQKFGKILNDLMYPPVTGIDLRKVITPELVNLRELLAAIYQKSESLSELINNIKDLGAYQTNGKLVDMVNFLVENADNLGDGIDMVKNIFFQSEEESISGFYDEKTNTAYIVADAVKESTPYHEIFLHPFLINLEKTNPEFYKQLVAEAKANQEIVNYVEKNYGKEDQIGSRQFEHELVGRAYDLSLNNKISERKNPGLFKKIGQFFKRMAKAIGEFFGLPSTDISKLDPRKTKIADLAQYSLTTTDKINLGKVVEAEQEARPVDETIKPRTRKKTVKSVRTVIEEQTVNKGGDLIVLENASDRPDIFGDFLHPEILYTNNLLVAEWTQKLVDLGKELDDARITKWVYGNIRAQVDGRLIIDVTVEVPVFVKKALANKKANPKVAELQKEIADLDSKIQTLNSKKKTPAPKSKPSVTDTNAIRNDIAALKALYDSDYMSSVRSRLWTLAFDELKEEAVAKKSFFGKVKDPTPEEINKRAYEKFITAVQSTKDTTNTSELNYSVADGLYGWGIEGSSSNVTADINSTSIHPDQRHDYQLTSYGTTSWAEYYEGYSEQGKRVLNIRVPVKNIDESTRGTNRPSVYISFTVEMPEGFTAAEIAQPIVDKFKKVNKRDRVSTKEAEKIIAEQVLEAFKKGPKAEKKIELSDLPIVADNINTEKVMGKAIYIPMSVYEEAYANDSGNNPKLGGGGQTLLTIISRGGYAASELDNLLPNWKEKVYDINNPGKRESLFDELDVETSIENDAIDREIEDTLKKRNALQDQLNAETTEIIEEGEETVQQGTKEVTFLMYKSTGTGSTAKSLGEWVPLNAIGKFEDGTEWFVKAMHDGQDPKLNKYGSSVFANIDRDLKANESVLFNEPENWVTETTEKQIEEEVEIEEEIPTDEVEEQAPVQEEGVYRSRTEILNDVNSITAEIKKLEADYDKLLSDINVGNLSRIQKRKARRSLELMAIDINDLYAQLKDLQPELNMSDDATNLAVQDAEYVPAYDYNGNEIITHEMPWMNVPQGLRNELAELFGKPLNKLTEEDVVKIKAELKSNPNYISVVNAYTQARLQEQDERLGSEEAQKNRQKIEEEKVRTQQRQKDLRDQAKADKRKARLARAKSTDEDILKSILKDYDYSILTKEEIKQLVSDLKSKKLTANDLIAYVSNKKIKQAQQKKAEKKEQEQIKNNMSLFEKYEIPFTNNDGKKIKLRIPNNGMRKFIMTYHSDIFSLSENEFLNKLNAILTARSSFIKQFKVDPEMFVKGDTKVYIKIYNLFKKLEKQKQLYPDVVKKINLALFNAETNWRIKIADKNGSVASMYQIKKIKDAKKIIPLGVYGKSKQLKAEDETIDEDLKQFLDQGMSLEEATDTLLTLQFLNTPEGQEILDADAEEMDRLAQSMENELLNGEFTGDESTLSDSELELKDIGEEYDPLDAEIANDLANEEVEMPEEIQKPSTKVNSDLEELQALASLPFQNQKEKVLGEAWKRFDSEDISFMVATYKLTTTGRFKFSDNQVNATISKILKQLQSGKYNNLNVMVNGKPYMVINTEKTKITLQDLNTKSNTEFEMVDFLNSFENQLEPGTVVNNLNVDTVVKVEEFAYIKGAYNDILNNFTSYMGEANSLTEEKLLASLKEETTKCK